MAQVIGDVFRGEGCLHALPGQSGQSDAWLDKRADLPGSDGPALFLSLKGRRLSARAIDLAVRHLGQEADVGTSAHTLRHTCLTRLVRAGNDIVLVAELAGHSRLETTRRYSLPSDADKPPWTASPPTTDWPPDSRP